MANNQGNETADVNHEGCGMSRISEQNRGFKGKGHSEKYQ